MNGDTHEFHQTKGGKDAEIAALRERVGELEAAVEYYRTAIVQTRTAQKPRHVPTRVRVLKTVQSEIPIRRSRVMPGDYDCECNPYGAVSVRGSDGQQLGLKLDEFVPLAWRENEASPTGGG